MSLKTGDHGIRQDCSGMLRILLFAPIKVKQLQWAETLQKPTIAWYKYLQLQTLIFNIKHSQGKHDEDKGIHHCKRAKTTDARNLHIIDNLNI